VSFNTWLLEGLDTPGRVATFGKLVWDDINNGCGSSKYSAVAWKAHFEEKHPEHYKKLTDMLLLAYTEYALRFKGK
jgi:hypothetical protein